jgi:hypothetical protein
MPSNAEHGVEPPHPGTQEEWEAKQNGSENGSPDNRELDLPFRVFDVGASNRGINDRKLYEIRNSPVYLKLSWNCRRCAMI